ncbi:M24 family metallopeptidase [Candidatus Woesearchaeota archaeon]|nr:M24 family metallopeptidase [Candidatus Woesearchaeota archaeon]
MIDHIRESCKISCEILSECFDNFYFETEIEVAKWLRKKTKERNCKVAFPPLVVSGNNFLEIHHNSNKTKLKKFIIVDFGVKYEGYCSDVTRMLYKGKPGKEELEMYELIVKVQKNALKNSELRKDYCDIDLKARIDLGRYKKYFEHSLGHGVSRKIHQKPWVNFKSKDIVKENDVVTIEPGVYTKKFGIRIEDTILIRKNKVEILTPLSKKLIVLD